MKRSVKAKRIALAGRFMAESCFRSPLHLTDTPDKVIIKLPQYPCFCSEAAVQDSEKERSRAADLHFKQGEAQGGKKRFDVFGPVWQFGVLIQQ